MPKQLQLLPRAVLSLVRDILELNYCTKLFHQTVHALSAQLCKTRQNIGVSRGKHHSNKTAFSIAFFAAFSAFFPHFSAFFANPGDHIFPPPLVELSFTHGTYLKMISMLLGFEGPPPKPLLDPFRLPDV